MRNLGKSIIYSILFCLMFSCHTSKNLVRDKSPSLSKTIELTSTNEIKKGGEINFQFVNTSLKNIIIYYPAKKRIEKFENNHWRNVRILYCPCGADCLPPPKTKEMKPGEKYTYNWDLMESWCDKKKGNNIPKTIEKNSLEGLYRTKVRYSVNKDEIKEITREFKIIN